MLADGEAARPLRAAGYPVRAIESAERLGAQVDGCERPPVGAVVPDGRMAELAGATRGTHAGALVVAMRPDRRIDDVLAMLDRRL